MMGEIMIRSKKEIKQSLLKRAVRENRGAEMILTLQWMRAKLDHQTEGVSQVIKEFDFANYGQPRAVKYSNIIAEIEGSDVRLSDNNKAVQNAPSTRTLN